MDYVLRFKDLSHPVKNAFRIYEKSLIRVKILKGQKKLLKYCYDSHIMPLSIDVKLKNLTESFPPARKFILEHHIKSARMNQKTPITIFVERQGLFEDNVILDI